MKIALSILLVFTGFNAFAQEKEIQSSILPDSSNVVFIHQEKKMLEEIKLSKTGDTLYYIKQVYVLKPEAWIKSKAIYIANKVSERRIYARSGKDSIIEKRGNDDRFVLTYHIDSTTKTEAPVSYPAETVWVVDNEKVFADVDQKADFKGGMEAMQTFMSENLNYPAEAKATDIEGHVFVIFVVETDGSISNVKVKNPGRNHASLEKAAIELVKKSSGKWIPGKKGGVPVKSYCVLPVTFMVDDE